MGCQNCSGHFYSRLPWNLNNLSSYPLMVIGESPTAAETKKGEVMTGSGAQVLKDTMKKVGLPTDSTTTYFTTALKCAVPKKKGQKIAADVPGNCREYLIAEIRTVKPKMVLICGATALQTLTGNSKVKISEEYGRLREYPFLPGVKVIPIMNPSVLMHNPGDYKPFLAMLQLAAHLYHDGELNDAGETRWTVIETKQQCYTLWEKMNKLAAEGKLSRAAYDIETTGLDYRKVDFLVMGICFEEGHTYVIPRELQQFAHNFLEGIKWKALWQGGKYDKKVMWRRKLGCVPIDDDTMYQHYVLDETSEHDLGYLSKVFLNAPEYKYKMNQNWKAVSLETYPAFFEALCERVAVDCNYTFQLANKFDQILAEPNNAGLRELYHDLILPAANFLTRVEQNGIPTDESYLNELDAKYRVLLDHIKDEIYALAEPFWDRELYMKQSGAKSAPELFNPGSPLQMSWMVFDRLKINPRIKRGRSTDKDVLKSIENPIPLIKKVLEYRTVQKEHSTYVIGILDARDTDGRVRTTFTLHVTATGRLSSKEPNVQNQSSANGVGNVRKAFIAPEGHILAEVDYSGAELRWLAFLSKCPVLSEVFLQDRNLHNETAKALFGEHFTKQQKMRAKAINFGIPYGREANSIAEEFNFPVAEAQETIDKWLDTYYGARDYLNWCAEQVVQGNYLESPWKRRRRFGLVTPISLHSLQNEAKNFPIQSSSSDTLLKASMLMEKDLWEKWQTLILNLIHDSDLLSIPAVHEKVWEVAQYTDRVMSAVPKDLFNCPIPFKTDFEIGLSWGEMVGFNRNTGKVEIENKDDTITVLDFYDWYNQALEVLAKERADRRQRLGF